MDSVNSVHCHPTCDMIGASIGQRHFSNNKSVLNKKEDDSDDESSTMSIHESMECSNNTCNSGVQFWKLKL